MPVGITDFFQYPVTCNLIGRDLNSVIQQVSSPNCNLKKPHRPIPTGSYKILQATEHAQNHVAADLMLKSCILFISLNRNNDCGHTRHFHIILSFPKNDLTVL